MSEFMIEFSLAVKITPDGEFREGTDDVLRNFESVEFGFWLQWANDASC